MANIAEGFHRNTTRDFLKFLDYSRSSVAETLSHGYVALDQGAKLKSVNSAKRPMQYGEK
jgi:four helix bundle protein